MARRTRGRPPHPDVLTPAEWAALEMWRHGLSMTAIATRQGISRYGVRYHLRNVGEKLGVASTRELRHWPGMAIDSARQRQEMTMSDPGDTLRLGALGQVSMLCRSAPQTEAWYRDVLGLAHVFTFGDLVFFDCGGVRLFMREVADDEWRASSILYFLVPDMTAAHAALIDRGVRFSGAPHMIYRDDASGVEEWMAFFDDPDGNVLALMSRVGGAA